MASWLRSEYMLIPALLFVVLPITIKLWHALARLDVTVQDSGHSWPWWIWRILQSAFIAICAYLWPRRGFYLRNGALLFVLIGVLLFLTKVLLP